MKTIVLLLMGISTFGQEGKDPCEGKDLCITATVQANDTVDSLFGPLNKGKYGAATVDICSQIPRPITGFALGHIRQNAHVSGVTILSNEVAQAVIASAQGKTKKAVIGRIVFAITASATVAVGTNLLKPLTKTIVTDISLSGQGIWNSFALIATPNALINYSSVSLPEILQFQPAGCLPKPGIQLIQGKLVAGTEVKFGIMVTDTTTIPPVILTPVPGANFVTPTTQKGPHETT